MSDLIRMDDLIVNLDHVRQVVFGENTDDEGGISLAADMFIIMGTDPKTGVQLIQTIRVAGTQAEALKVFLHNNVRDLIAEMEVIKKAKAVKGLQKATRKYPEVKENEMEF